MQEQEQELKRIVVIYNLSPDDVYLHKDGWKIIRSKAIKKIINHEEINVRKSVDFVSADGKTVIVTCGVTAEIREGEYISYEAVGEVSPANNTFPYPANVAEKRAEARAVLQILDLYKDQWRGEDEMDEMVQGTKILAKREEQTKAAVEETLRITDAPKKTLKMKRNAQVPVTDKQTKDVLKESIKRERSNKPS